MASSGHRATLSGIGGDTVTFGGVPAPTIELQDLLATGRFFELARQLNAWAAKMKKPRLPLLYTAVQGFFCRSVAGLTISRPTPWLRPAFVRRNYAALCAYPWRVKVFGPLPSFQENIAALNVLRRLLARWPLHPDVLCEVRFPYLDRDFLEFMYAIPHQQIVGVGKRRFLMKRSLLGIVPSELLERRRRAFIPPKPATGISTEWSKLEEMGHQPLVGFMGIIDPNRFSELLQEARDNEGTSNCLLSRTVTLEFWLRHLTSHSVLRNLTPMGRQSHSFHFEEKELRKPPPPQKFS